MDVGNPSNFSRVLALYGSDIQRMREDIQAESFHDDQTLSAIDEVYRKYQYLCDPHTAIAYLGAKKFQHNGPRIFLATAHPAKFPEVVKRACGVDVEMPEVLRECLGRKKKSIKMESDYAKLKEFLFAG
jgi:threonine synthase